MGQERSHPGQRACGLPLADLISDEMKRQSLSFATVAERIRIASIGENERSGVTRQLVCRWSQGRIVPQRDHIRWLAQALGLPVERLALAAEAQRKGLTTSEAGTLTKPVELGGLQQSRSSGSGDDMPPAESFALAAQESAQFVRRAGMRINEITLDQIEAEVRLLSQRYLSEPPAHLFQPLVQLRGEVFALLRTHQPTRYLNRLYLSAGQLCALLAHMSCDLNYPDVAATHARTAWLCADLCGHNALRAHVRWIQAQIAYWQGEYRRSAEIVQSGWDFATDQVSRLRLASEEARALASAGESSQVERSLAVASSALGESRYEPSDMMGAFKFPAGKARYYAAEVYIHLGGLSNLKRAVLAATESLELLMAGPEEDTCPQFFAAAQLDLATAHLGLQGLDAAAHYLQPVLALPPEHRTHALVRRVSKIKVALNGSAYVSAPSARELDEQVDLFCSTAATHSLPEATVSSARTEEW
jgi:hypothetical protein